MKKKLLIGLGVLLAVSLTACQNTAPEEPVTVQTVTETQTETESETQTESETENGTPAIHIRQEKVAGEVGVKINLQDILSIENGEGLDVEIKLRTEDNEKDTSKDESTENTEVAIDTESESFETESETIESEKEETSPILSVTPKNESWELSFSKPGEHSVDISLLDKNKKQVTHVTVLFVIKEPETEAKETETETKEKATETSKPVSDNSANTNSSQSNNTTPSTPDSNALTGNSSSNEATPAGNSEPSNNSNQPAHSHIWVPIYQSVTEDQGSYQTVVITPEWTETIPGETVVVCGCGAEFPVGNAWEEHQASFLNVGDFSHPSNCTYRTNPGETVYHPAVTEQQWVSNIVTTQVQTGEQCSGCGATR